MDKDEILARSRAENKNQDMHEQEVIKRGQTVSLLVMVTLATVFFAVQIFVGGRCNYGLYALVFSGCAALFWVKWGQLRRRHELVLALFYTVVAASFSCAHIYQLISTSTVL